MDGSWELNMDHSRTTSGNDIMLSLPVRNGILWYLCKECIVGKLLSAVTSFVALFPVAHLHVNEQILKSFGVFQQLFHCWRWVKFIQFMKPSVFKTQTERLSGVWEAALEWGWAERLKLNSGSWNVWDLLSTPSCAAAKELCPSLTNSCCKPS